MALIPLILSLALLLGEAPPRPELTWVINEIQYAPPDNALEFIELFNATAAPRDLCALSFSDNRNQIVPICEGSSLVPPRGYAVIARDSAALIAVFPGLAVVEPPSWPALNNSGDAVRLYDENAVLIEETSYEPSWGGQGVSLERIDPAGPSSAGFNWASSIDPRGATPGARNSRYAPDTTPPEIVFAELTEAAMVTTRWSESLDAARLTPDLFRVGGITPQTLRYDPPETLLLFFSSPVTADKLQSESVRDLTGNASSLSVAPIARIPATGDLILNEILFEPRADPFDYLPDQPEYVEIHSLSSDLLSLRSVVLTGYADERNHADTIRSAVPFPVLAPGGFAVLYAAPSSIDPDDVRDPLRAAFPGLDSSALLLPVRQASLRLNNAGDFVRLTAGGATILDEFAYDAAWHHPNLAETRGVALERRSSAATAQFPSNWSSSLDPSGGTPGRANSLASTDDPAPDVARPRITPNPFSPDGDGIDDALVIQPAIAATAQFIRITIFDAQGRVRRLLTPGSLAGSGEAYIWDGRDDGGAFLPSGIYIILLEDLHPNAGRSAVYKETVVLARRMRD